MLNFNSLLIFSEEPQALAEFYEKVFEKKPDWSDGEWFGFGVGSAMISIGPHSEVRGKSQEGKRIMFNLETVEVETEYKRIKDLGAEVIAKPYKMGDKGEMWIATFADPDGNYFQLMSPFVDYSVNWSGWAGFGEARVGMGEGFSGSTSKAWVVEIIRVLVGKW